MMFESEAVVERLRDPSQVRVRIVRMDGGTAIAKLLWASDGGGPSIRPRVVPLTEQDAMMRPGPEEWLYLEPWDARALYDALAETYGHTVGDARQLRGDFEHERRRVDKLIDFHLRP